MTLNSELSEPPLATAVHTLQTMIGGARRFSNMTGLADLVLAQLVHVMGGRTPVAVASDLEFRDAGLTGRVVLFGDRLLFVAEIRDAPTEGYDFEGIPVTWSAAVTLFPRSALRSIEAAAIDAHTGRVVDLTVLARQTKVVLHYEGIDDPIVLTSQNTRDLGAVLALVSADLEEV